MVEISRLIFSRVFYSLFISYMLKRKVPFYYLLLSCLLCAGLTVFGYHSSMAGASVAEEQIGTKNLPSSSLCQVDEPRLAGYSFIQPLLSVEPECESEKLMNIKSSISDQIQSFKNAGVITSASVYLKDFNNGDWISLNEQERYQPGSLMKVPTMIACLKMCEEDPMALDRVEIFQHPLTGKVQAFKSKSLTLGEKYKVRDLLQYMIAYSDNDATTLLVKEMNKNIFRKVFSDLQLPPVNMQSSDNPFTAHEISAFLNTIYNASYLNINNSEYAAALLAESDFSAGIQSGLPSGIKIVHKFGETGDGVTSQLHETAIIYIGKSAYLLTVMTKGKDMDQLPAVLSSISKLAYSGMLHLQKPV